MAEDASFEEALTTCTSLPSFALAEESGIGKAAIRANAAIIRFFFIDPLSFNIYKYGKYYPIIISLGYSWN